MDMPIIVTRRRSAGDKMTVTLTAAQVKLLEALQVSAGFIEERKGETVKVVPTMSHLIGVMIEAQAKQVGVVY